MKIAALPVSQSVIDGDVTLRIRRIAGQVQVSAEVYSHLSNCAVTIILPHLSASAAGEFSKVLQEAATGIPAGNGELPGGNLTEQ